MHDGWFKVELGATFGNHIAQLIPPFHLEADPCFQWLVWENVYPDVRLLRVRNGFNASDPSLDDTIGLVAAYHIFPGTNEQADK